MGQSTDHHDTGTTAAPSHPWALTAALLGIVLAFLLQLASPLPELDWLEGNERPFARGRLVGRMLLSATVAPDVVVESWCGGDASPGLFDRLPVVAITVSVLAVATAAGWLFLRAFGIARHLWRLEQIVFAAGIGLSLVSLVVLAVGLSGWLRESRWWLVAGGLVMMLFATVSAVRPGAQEPKQPGCRSRPDSETLSRHWLWLAAPIVVVLLLGGMLPPIDFDVREYHLQAPKEFYQQGRITFLPHNVYGNMPLGAEMLALLGMVLAGDWWLGALVGKTLIAAFAPLTALALLAAGKRLSGTTTGVAAAVVYLSIPWIVRVSNLGLNEGVYGFYLFLAAYGIWLWKRTCDPRLVGMAGFLTGAAVSVKYTAALFVAVPLAAAVLAPAAPRLLRSSRGAALVIFVLTLLLGCGLWFAKNLAYTGNPTYPLAYRFFGGETRTDAMDAQWRRAHRPPSYAPGDLVAKLTDVAWRSAWQSPLVLPLALAALLVRRTRRIAVSWWYLAAFVLACWWLFTHRIDRFWVPLLPVFALLAGLGADCTAHRIWRIALRIALVGWVAMATALAIGPEPVCGYPRFLASYEWLRTADERLLPWRNALHAAASPDMPVLSVGDAQVFDLEIPVYYNTVFDHWLLADWMGDGPWEQQVKQLRTELHSRNIGLVYIHWGELARYRRTYDHESGFSNFITPELRDRLIDANLLRPAAIPVGDAPVSVYEVVNAGTEGGE